MGKLATTGGRVTRDNEEREASVWSVERSGASSCRAFVAVSTDGIVVGGGIVRAVAAAKRKDFIRTTSYSRNVQKDNGNANPSSRWFLEKRGIERLIETIEGDATAFAFSFEKHKRRSRGSLDLGEYRTLVDSRSIERRGIIDRAGGCCRYQFARATSASGGLLILLGLAAIGAALCVPASGVPMQSRTDPYARTGLRYNLDRSTGLEDVYEDAFENAFQEEDRPTTRTVLDDTELDIIRRSIVRGLGLKRIPDPSKANVSQAEYERAHKEYLKKVQSSFDEQNFNGNKKLHVFHATAYPGNDSRSERDERYRHRYRYRHRHRHRLFFPVEIPEENHVASVDHATLRLLLHGSIDHDYNNVLHRFDVDALLYLRAERTRKLLVRKRIELEDWRNSIWLEFDSTLAVSSWLDGDLENFGLELEFFHDGQPVSRTFSSPVLNVFTTGNLNPRTKRSTPEELMSLHKGRRSKCKGESKKCCRHELTVMFKDLRGFDFIVYPKTFDAGYCKGRCPPRYNPAHHHALLQSLLWKEDRKKVPKPCCAPSKLDQLMILYYDEDDSTQLKVSYWQNIQVLECACS
ncbi:bone morphogenetic protein 4 [Osmia bicornis bicornis]|uniref:bone morphogenetic protein 4 n=1 Tax=Osmia bicornis bicornis TaxID=1437191 RepID=UPI001EAEF2BF|nr:bone morphogenetic protein 4 [Osmia bicornis bicornis]